MEKNPIIAHISDLHFGTINHNADAETALALDLLNVEPRPEFIVVTGDLSQFGLLGLKKGIESAKQFLDKVLKDLYTIHRHVARYIVVPGNHDLVLGCHAAFWNSVFPNGGGKHDSLFYIFTCFSADGFSA